MGICWISIKFLLNREIYYFISLWTVIFLRIGLNFLISILSGVFFLFLVVMYLEVPGIPESLCSVHSKITWTLLPFFAITWLFLCHSRESRNLFYQSLCSCLFNYARNTFLINDFQRLCRNFKRNPTVFFRKIETFLRKIYVKPSFGLVDGERYVVTEHRSFPRNLTNFWHCADFSLNRVQIYIIFTGQAKEYFRFLKFLFAAIRGTYERFFVRFGPCDFP